MRLCSKVILSILMLVTLEFLPSTTVAQVQEALTRDQVKDQVSIPRRLARRAKEIARDDPVILGPRFQLRQSAQGRVATLSSLRLLREQTPRLTQPLAECAQPRRARARHNQQHQHPVG